MSEALDGPAWAVDDTGLLTYGTASPGVARQYTGTGGRVTSCQVAVSVSMDTDTDTASGPVGWGLRPPVLVADAGYGDVDLNMPRMDRRESG